MGLEPRWEEGSFSVVPSNQLVSYLCFLWCESNLHFKDTREALCHPAHPSPVLFKWHLAWYQAAWLCGCPPSPNVMFLEGLLQVSAKFLCLSLSPERWKDSHPITRPTELIAGWVGVDEYTNPSLLRSRRTAVALSSCLGCVSSRPGRVREVKDVLSSSEALSCSLNRRLRKTVYFSFVWRSSAQVCIRLTPLWTLLVVRNWKTIFWTLQKIIVTQKRKHTVWVFCSEQTQSYA